jgi:hypothetical protein
VHIPVDLALRGELGVSDWKQPCGYYRRNDNIDKGVRQERPEDFVDVERKGR